MSLRQYYAVFTPPARRHWWSKLLNRRIGHCLLVITEGPDAVVVERHIYGVEVNFYPAHTIEDVLSSLRVVTPLVALHVHHPPLSPKPSFYFGFFSCVTLVKAALGLSAPVFTPFQLCRYLLTHHTITQVFPNDKYHRPESAQGSNDHCHHQTSPAGSQ